MDAEPLPSEPCAHRTPVLVEYVERPCGEIVTVWECPMCSSRLVDQDAP